jgi:hypothetical protein
MNCLCISLASDNEVLSTSVLSGHFQIVITLLKIYRFESAKIRLSTYLLLYWVK